MSDNNESASVPSSNSSHFQSEEEGDDDDEEGFLRARAALEDGVQKFVHPQIDITKR